VHDTKVLGKTSGKKTERISVKKLDDANDAGSRKFAKDCTLILTEGDSAKTLAISGLSVVGRDRYGVFPLRGKLLNVRDAPTKQVASNEEIQAITKILGLRHGMKYDEESIKNLRYGHLMLMTDQDLDGSHIKGLLLNFVEKFWPSLLEVPNFLQEFITPIVKVFFPPFFLSSFLQAKNKRKLIKVLFVGDETKRSPRASKSPPSTRTKSTKSGRERRLTTTSGR
jgi:DNA topoisomerase II